MYSQGPWQDNHNYLLLYAEAESNFYFTSEVNPTTPPKTLRANSYWGHLINLGGHGVGTHRRPYWALAQKVYTVQYHIATGCSLL